MLSTRIPITTPADHLHHLDHHANTGHHQPTSHRHPSPLPTTPIPDHRTRTTAQLSHNQPPHQHRPRHHHRTARPITPTNHHSCRSPKQPTTSRTQAVSKPPRQHRPPQPPPPSHCHPLRRPTTTHPDHPTFRPSHPQPHRHHPPPITPANHHASRSPHRPTTHRSHRSLTTTATPSNRHHHRTVHQPRANHHASRSPHSLTTRRFIPTHHANIVQPSPPSHRPPPTRQPLPIPITTQTTSRATITNHTPTDNHRTPSPTFNPPPSPTITPTTNPTITILDPPHHILSVPLEPHLFTWESSVPLTSASLHPPNPPHYPAPTSAFPSSRPSSSSSGNPNVHTRTVFIFYEKYVAAVGFPGGEGDLYV